MIIVMIKPLILDVIKQLKSQVDNKDIPYYLLHSGICYCTYNMLYDQKEDELARIRTISGTNLSISNLINITFEPYFKKWPKFSGNEEFPVPNPVGKCPRHIYWNNESMWTGEYGRLRIELLGFLISELEKELKPA